MIWKAWLPGVVELATVARGARPARSGPPLGALLATTVATVALLPEVWAAPHPESEALGLVIFALAALLAMPSISRDEPEGSLESSLFFVLLTPVYAFAARLHSAHPLTHLGSCSFERMILMGSDGAFPLLLGFWAFWGGVMCGVVYLVLWCLRVRDGELIRLRSLPRWALSALLVLVGVVTGAFVAEGVASSRHHPYEQRAFSRYLDGLEVVGRLPAAPEREPRPGDQEGPWQARKTARGPMWVAPVGDQEVYWLYNFPHTLARVGEEPAWSKRSPDHISLSVFLSGRSPMEILRDRQRDLVFFKLEGEKPVFSHDDSTHVLALRGPVFAPAKVAASELFGPQPAPRAWVLLAASGLAGAIAALLLGRRELRQFERGTCLIGVADEHGAIELPGASASYPPGARVVAGPVVVFPQEQARPATYRAEGSLGPVVVVPGTPQRVNAAIEEARWNAAGLALAILALTVTPLVVALHLAPH